MTRQHVRIMIIVTAVLVSTEAQAQSKLGVEIGSATRVHSFAPNARRPVGIGGEIQLLPRLTDNWYFRVGGGYGFGGRGNDGKLHAAWVSTSVQWKLSPHWSLAFGAEHEQRYLDFAHKAETYHFGGFVEGKVYFLESGHHSLYLGYRPVLGALNAEIDLLDSKVWYFSTINSFTIGYVYLP